MSSFSKRIAFVGGGNMAEAIFSGLIHKQTLDSEDIFVTDVLPERRQYLEKKYSIATGDSNADAPQKASCLVIAVKPKHLFEINEDIRPHLTGEHMIVSILAGQSIERLGEAFGNPQRIVRVMPNLPAQVGQGVSAITFPDGLAVHEKQFVREILQSVGAIVEVPENLQDAVTAVSGSGPGYMFHLADCFIAAAIEQGLSDDIARSLVTETMAGAAQVLRERSDSPSELVRKVATPGGTTEAGLSALMDGQVDRIFREMVKRATNRSKELNRS